MGELLTIQKKKQYPYQVLTLDDLPKEEWADIPGLEGYYLVSNLGRVKRDPFEIICVNGQVRKVKSMILRTGITKSVNKFIKDEQYGLRVKICMSGIRYNFNIGRLVYYCFIKKFDLSHHSLVILSKDCDGKNIRPGNLILANLKHKQKRIHDRGRYYRDIVSSYDEFLSGSIRSANIYCVQISQYDAKGHKVQTFPSIEAAAKATNTTAVAINATLKERQRRTGGFYWRYGKAAKINLKAEQEKLAIKRKENRGQKVSQYNTKGKLIATYLTVSDAAKAAGIGSGDISSVFSSRQQSAGGFLWRKGWGKNKIEVKGLVFGEKLRAQRRWKKVKQYSPDGKYLQTFPSVKAAAASLQVTPSYISWGLDKKNRLAKGFILRSAK